jgi:hypothetical protein
VNIKSLLGGMVFGTFIAASLTALDHYRAKPLPPIVRATPAPSVSVEPIESRLRNYDAHDAWLKRRELEFDRCAALHGTPTLGFGMKVVCLDSHSVKFVGESAPED